MTRPISTLITGGAGFIGTCLARRLVSEGWPVTIFDNFNAQIHGEGQSLPPDLASQVRLIRGDVRDRAALAEALAGQQAVVHLAAETGTGQSMYQIEHYERVNLGGTANLLDCLVNDRYSSVQKLIIASSRAIYGEGRYRCAQCGSVSPSTRQLEDLRAGHFEPRCPRCQAFCQPEPTDEDAPFQPSSFYGLTKQAQEQMGLMFARTLGLSAFALRYQNVYGPGQSLQNPYTGILAIFAMQARTGQPIYVFEDGQESRDFEHVEDALEATWRCLLPDTTGVEAFNVGSGEATTVESLARTIAAYFGNRSEVSITGAFRQGDIRHNWADLTRARRRLGFAPRWKFADGLELFLRWAQAQPLPRLAYEQSLIEMRGKGLLHG